MNSQARWSDAETAAKWVRDSDVECAILILLARLPLLPVNLIDRLTGPSNGLSTTYRRLARLRAAGLVASVRPATIPGHAPTLSYLTDLGIATVGLLTGVEPAVLAHQHRLRATDLAALLLRLPQVLACYELLSALTTAQQGPLVLSAWELPYRRTVQRPNAVTPLRIDMPAYVAFQNGEEMRSLLFYPDLAMVPLRAERSRLSRLIMARSVKPETVPLLIIATSPEQRAQAWQALLDEVARQHSVTPSPAHVVTWNALHCPTSCTAETGRRQTRMVQLDVMTGNGPRTSRSHRAAPLPSLAGDLTSPTVAKTHRRIRLGQLVLQLGPIDEQLLDLAAHHPFLSRSQLADVLVVAMPTLRQRCNRLIAAGLLRFVGPDELGSVVSDGEALVEATHEGLTLVAACRGLTLAAAVRHLGLAGGGPADPVGQRVVLLRQLEHTRGVNDLFVRFHRTARRPSMADRDAALVAWRNAAACAHGHLRPDAYGVYRHHDRLAGFFLEYDRGTMTRRGYAAKFASYFAYRERAQSDLDYDGFPMILMVTTDDVTEERIAEVARTAAVGRAPLPLLLTCLPRLDDPRNRSGLLGPIWRDAHATPTVRRPWFDVRLPS